MTKVAKTLQLNLRSDYGGGPHHMYQLISHFSPSVEVYAAMPKEYPYWERNAALLGEQKCFELPHRSMKWSVLARLVIFTIRNKIDIIHAHGKGASIYGRLLALFTGKPCVYTFHGLHYGKYSPLQKWLYFLTEKALFFLTKKYISVSEGEAKEIRSHLSLLASKLQVISAGVDVKDVHAKELGKGPIVITIIARLDYQKNLVLLIPIVKELKLRMDRPFVVNVVGVPSEPNELSQLIEQNGLAGDILLRGFSNQVSEWLVPSHFYLSTSRWEGLPISLLEAMALGLVPIVSDVVGNNDVVIEAQNGFLYPVDQPQEAAQKILDLINNPSLYADISSAASTTIRDKFSLEKMVQKTELLYGDVLKVGP